MRTHKNLNSIQIKVFPPTLTKCKFHHFKIHNYMLFIFLFCHYVEARRVLITSITSSFGEKIFGYVCVLGLRMLIYLKLNDAACAFYVFYIISSIDILS